MLDCSRIDSIRQTRPLLHCVSNLVSMNDCANLALAVGASPIMAQAPEEMEEITEISSATVLNMGTPDRERFEICRICGNCARERKQPLVLDPVGVGASRWRLREVSSLLAEVRPTILRVNLGEAEALCREDSRERGVDSIMEAAREYRLALVGKLAGSLCETVLLTGEEDLVSDGKRVFSVTGGSGRMTKVTGTGCMLSVLCGAFAAVEPDAAAAAALAAGYWKLCAEKADQMTRGQGSGSFRTALMDAAELLTAEELSDRANIREIG